MPRKYRIPPISAKSVKKFRWKKLARGVILPNRALGRPFVNGAKNISIPNGGRPNAPLKCLKRAQNSLSEPLLAHLRRYIVARARVGNKVNIEIARPPSSGVSGDHRLG